MKAKLRRRINSMNMSIYGAGHTRRSNDTISLDAYKGKMWSFQNRRGSMVLLIYSFGLEKCKFGNKEEAQEKFICNMKEGTEQHGEERTLGVCGLGLHGQDVFRNTLKKNRCPQAGKKTNDSWCDLHLWTVCLFNSLIIMLFKFISILCFLF